MLRLTIFDLDHTLLDGDSDVLWCEFLMDRGLLDRAEFGVRNTQMERAYRDGTVGVAEFCSFFIATLALKSRPQWEPWRRAFLAEVIAPRLPAAAHTLVRQHLDEGDLVVMSTATNRFITELTARHLGIEHLIATECEQAGDTFTGCMTGTPNMREGKVARLQAWLAERGLKLADCDTTFYSDSMNDLPLLSVVKYAVTVNPDERLAAVAAERGWPVLNLRRLAA
jgi:HAD superfamily hydrolase (TIGR01490 family)